MIFAPLKPIDERKGKGHAASDIVARVSPKLFGIPGAIVVAFEPPAIRALAASADFNSSCRTSGEIRSQDIDTVAHKIVAASRQRKDLTGLFTSFTANDPQNWSRSTVTRPKPWAFPSARSHRRLGVYMGSEYVNDFDFNNRSYRVYVQADQPFR